MASSIIFNNDYLSINKFDEKTYLFRFVINDAFELQKTTYNIEGFLTETNISDTAADYTLTLQSVQTLEQLLAKKKGVLGYNDCLNIIQTLGTQLQKMEEEKKHIYASFQMKNIIVLNDTHYMYVSDQDIIAINDSNTITIDYPITPTVFSSPEQQTATSLPYTLHKNTWLFSFASIVAYCLTGSTASYESKKYDDKVVLLERIILLPLYFCLLRCFAEDPVKRTLIYI